MWNPMAMLALTLLAVGAAAQDTKIDSTTVVAPRDRAAIEREVRTFVNAIAVKPGDESLARWQSQIPLCPLVAGLQGSRLDGFEIGPLVHANLSGHDCTHT